ncbi:hypothetical protein J1614_005867, partial [Plenodomus biglobosus]
ARREPSNHSKRADPNAVSPKQTFSAKKMSPKIAKKRVVATWRYWESTSRKSVFATSSTHELARIEDQKLNCFAEPQRDVIPLDHTTD